MKHFRGAFLFTIVCLIIAFLWVHHNAPGNELKALFIVLVLGILEISLSFDNAVVNAMKLEKLPPKWQHRFLTWGIAIAVFGMRFLFPLLVVSIFAKLNLINVINMALNDPDKYTHYLTLSHPSIITFGGAFLIMLFFNYFFNKDKDCHWICFIESKMKRLGKVGGISIILTLVLIFTACHFAAWYNQADMLKAGIAGIITFILIETLSSALEKHSEHHEGMLSKLEHLSIVNFLYLELIDASFSLDGVLGAFALSKDILIITLGLSIGAMFVRSMTIMLVEHKTLKQYAYLEHGAHWAIGALAIIMFMSSFMEISEVITGFIGLVFIVSAFISSLIKNKNERSKE